MSGTKGKSGGHNKKRVSWGGIEFESLESFRTYHGYKSKGSFWYYREWGKKFRGHEIIVK